MWIIWGVLAGVVVGIFSGLLGVAGFAPALVSGLAKLVGFPARSLGGPAGQLASSNAVRNPARTASTAAALMIGLALVSFVAVLGKGLHGSVDRALHEQVSADWVISSKNGWSAFTAAAGAAAEKTPGITRSTSIRSDRGRAKNANATVNGVDPTTVSGLYNFTWRQGSSNGRPWRATSAASGSPSVLRGTRCCARSSPGGQHGCPRGSASSIPESSRRSMRQSSR